MVRVTSKRIREIRERLRIAQSRQKSYADQRQKPLEFEEGEHVFLKATSTTGVGRALRAKKLHSRFIGPFQIIKRVGLVAYQLALPPNLSNLHDVFHVSQLQKYIPNPSHVLRPKTVKLGDDLSYQAKPIEIVDHSLKSLRNKTIPLVKVIWQSLDSTEATWEKEQDMRELYPELFEDS